MVIKNHLNCFSTSDTTLAAWLIYQGFELLDLDRTKVNSVVFLFDGDSDNITQAVKTFNQGNAEGNILAFFRAYKNLLVRVKKA